MVRITKNSKPVEFLDFSPEEPGACVQCNDYFGSGQKRRVRDACGHVKCLSCAINVSKEECRQCPEVAQMEVSSDPDPQPEPVQTEKEPSVIVTISMKEGDLPTSDSGTPLMVGGREKERETPYKCSYCEMRFRFTYRLKIHLAKHLLKKIDEGDLKYQCSFCDQKFKWKRYDAKSIRNHFSRLCPRMCWEIKSFPSQ